MIAPTTNTRISFKDILFLTDFSRSSDAALPFAAAIARAFGANVHALHVLLPEPMVYTMPDMTMEALQAEEEVAREKMQHIEAQFEGIPHDAVLIRSGGVWQALEDEVAKTHADLVVMGTHGRTGTRKLLFGSVAEEIFRQSHIPVMTVGPQVHAVKDGGHYRRILFATDFTPESLAAAPYAISLAEENESRLVLLNVIPHSERESIKASAADALERLQRLIPNDAEFWCRPEAVVENGDAALRILELAGERGADLIILGVRARHQFGAGGTHFSGGIAHKIVTQAPCPVLTVRR